MSYADVEFSCVDPGVDASAKIIWIKPKLCTESFFLTLCNMVYVYLSYVGADSDADTVAKQK